MIFEYILLALSASIDALSIGITYGIKKAQISRSSNILIFVIVFCCSAIAILFGHFISFLFSPIFSILLGSSLLIFLGIYNIYKGIKKNDKSINFDIKDCYYIDNKETITLSIAIAIDAACVSMGVGIVGYTSLALPIFMAFFHTFFINCGNFAAKNTVNKLNIPSNILSIFSGTLLTLIGILRIFFA